MNINSVTLLTYENSNGNSFTAPIGTCDNAPDWIADTFVFNEAVKRKKVFVLKSIDTAIKNEVNTDTDAINSLKNSKNKKTGD